MHATNLVPMTPPTSITHLREKLHARIASLQRGGAAREAGDKDELLEERRRQRAALREKRRKETREKIRKEKERTGKDKGKERHKGTQAQVRRFAITIERL
jgi:hypothetical protein